MKCPNCEYFGMKSCCGCEGKPVDEEKANYIQSQLDEYLASNDPYIPINGELEGEGDR
jgi:hypothetical protein